MDAPLALAMPVEEAGIVATAMAAAGAFVLPTPRARGIAVLLALALTPVLLVGELGDSDQLRDIRDDPARAAAAAAGSLVVMAALATVFVRRPALLPPIAVAALPFRIPVEAGGETANLLVPLYFVIGAGGIAYAYERLRLGAETVGPREPATGRLEVALLIAVLLYTIQSSYSSDFEQAAKNVLFFYVPFVVLLKLLTAVEWSRRLLLRCLAVAVSLSLIFVAVGFWEYGVRELLLNPKVIEANEFKSYFRVNSLFFDPNIYGRFLAVVMVAVAASLLWSRRNRDVLVAALALGLLWGGLLLTFSQSSFASLLVGLAVLAGIRWGARPVLLVSGSLAALALAAVVAFPGLLKLDLGSERSLDKATSGRLDLMRGGLEMFADRPLWGFGSGSFEDRFREREDVRSERATAASHTILITIAAEQGLVGLLAYGLVVLSALGLLFRGLAPLGGRGPPSLDLLARGAVAAAFAALAFHTLVYAAFLEDPITWTLIAIGIAAPVAARSRAPAGRAATEPARAPVG